VFVDGPPVANGGPGGHGAGGNRMSTFHVGGGGRGGRGIERDEKRLSEKIYVCDEKDFYQLHDLIIRKVTNKYSPLSNQSSYGVFSSSSICS
jgi:hypothetical protein